jgi:hypothetical protein
LLILDAHTLRACPLALEMIPRFRVDSIVIPSHTSHICQIFDIGLASLLKRSIKTKLQQWVRDINPASFFNES